VIEVGPKVKGFAEGDLVTGDLGVDLGTPGCFASTFTLPSSKAYLVPKNIETKSAALVSALGAAVQTVRQFPVKGKTLFIAGAGAVGIMTALVAKEFGARAVSIFDPSSYRQTLAQGLGIDPLQDKEYDLAFEISGSQEGLSDCLRKVKKGGAIVLVGFQLPNSEAPWKLIVEKKLQVQGIFGKTPKSWEIALQLAQKGFPLSSLITHVYPFEEYEEAFNVALEGRCAKVLLEWKRKQKITLAPSVSEAA
jgi:threonine 3-dehydrogenase